MLGPYNDYIAHKYHDDHDQVSPGLFIGDRRTAENTRLLTRLGITHVLNAAEGPWEEFGFVNLNQQHFVNTGIIYQVNTQQLWSSILTNFLY